MSLIFTSCGFFSDEPAEPYIRDTTHDYDVYINVKALFPDSVKHDNKKPIDISIKGLYNRDYPFELLDTLVTDNFEYEFKFRILSDYLKYGENVRLNFIEIYSNSNCFDYRLSIRRDFKGEPSLGKGSNNCQSKFYRFDNISFTLYDSER